MTDVGNLYTNIGGYLELSFVMGEVGNLDVGDYFMYFL
jgi:hypothetical protein